MKSISIIACIISLSLSTCFAQYPTMVHFTNATAISDAKGFFKDSTRNLLLYKMHEPILSNCYLNKEVYRLTIPPDLMLAALIIKIEKSGDSISIETKEIKSDQVPEYNQFYETYTFSVDKTKPLDKNDYNTLMQLVDTLFAHPISADRMGNDGADWIFEMSTKAGYFYEKKWSPMKGDPIRNIGNLMIDLSALQHKKSFKKY